MKNMTKLSSAELAQRVVKVKVLVTIAANDILILFFSVFFRENKAACPTEDSHQLPSLIFSKKII